MFSTKRMLASDWRTLKYRHFTAGEFDHPNRMGREFIDWLDEVRERAGAVMVISSDWRDPAHNADVGGAMDSAHTDTPCNAVDIKAMPNAEDPHWNRARFLILQAALEMGCTRVGIYPNGSIHLDRTEDVRPAPRLWVQVDNPASP